MNTIQDICILLFIQKLKKCNGGGFQLPVKVLTGNYEQKIYKFINLYQISDLKNIKPCISCLCCKASRNKQN